MCTLPLRQPVPAPTITGNMYLGTVPGDPGIYILPNRSREHAIPLHGVESLALGPPPPKNQHQHIPGDKRSQVPDRGKKAHQRALAHITVGGGRGWESARPRTPHTMATGAPPGRSRAAPKARKASSQERALWGW